MKLTILIALFFSLPVFANQFDEVETMCMTRTKERVDELARAGIVIELTDALKIYQTCVDENEESFEERLDRMQQEALCASAPDGCWP